MKVFLPHNRLPMNEVERERLLHEYFGGESFSTKLLDGGWVLERLTIGDASSYADPKILKGIQWWSSTYGDVSISNLNQCFVEEDGFDLAFFDSWTLYFWAKWPCGLQQKPNKLFILHIDDHADLMSPRISGCEVGSIDFRTGNPVEIGLPQSIAAAVESGSVGIGSWLIPFIRLFDYVEVRHLCASAERFGRSGSYAMNLSTQPDTVLQPGLLKPILNLERHQDASNPPSRHYLVTDDLRAWVRGAPDWPILLHLDLDYFNNRYDGNSDYGTIPSRLDPPSDEVHDRIMEVLNVLEFSGLMPSVANVSVALSPGFFPTELWDPTVKLLRQRFSRRKRRALQ